MPRHRRVGDVHPGKKSQVRRGDDEAMAESGWQVCLYEAVNKLYQDLGCTNLLHQFSR